MVFVPKIRLAAPSRYADTTTTETARAWSVNRCMTSHAPTSESVARAGGPTRQDGRKTFFRASISLRSIADLKNLSRPNLTRLAVATCKTRRLADMQPPTQDQTRDGHAAQRLHTSNHGQRVGERPETAPPYRAGFEIGPLARSWKEGDKSPLALRSARFTPSPATFSKLILTVSPDSVIINIDSRATARGVPRWRTRTSSAPQSP